MPHGRLWAGVVGLFVAVATLAAMGSAGAAEPQLFPPGTGGLNGPGDVSPASGTGVPAPGAPATLPPAFLPKSAPAVQPAPQPIRQPVSQPVVYTGSQPVAQPIAQPAVQPAQPGLAPGSQTLSFSTEPVVKDLTPVGFADLIPPDPHHDGHHGHNGHGHAAHCDPCGEHHEIPEYLTPFVTDHRGFYGSAEFLLFRPRNSDFDYAIANTTAGLATTGPIDSLKYDTGTGVRAEVGYSYGRWETAFAYTYFTAGADRALAVSAGQVLFPTLTRPGLTDRALVALANADLDYQLFDMTAGRRFVLDENFAVRVLGGFRFADLRQTLNAVYDGADARRAAITTRSRFQGFGPIVGGEAVLVGWKGFHLYSRATGGLLTGRSDNRLIETNDAGATTYVNTRYNVRKVVPTATIAIGGGWQYRTVSIRGGYEMTYWHGVFERPRFVDDVSQGKVITRPSNLSLEGFFIQFGWAF
jgi:hypothetical protein